MENRGLEDAINLRKRLQADKLLVGMVHVRALPGSPGNYLNPEEIISKAAEEAMILKGFGIEAVMIENMHDTPYMRTAGPEITALMAVIGREVKKQSTYCGVQILAGANKEALAVAKASKLDFIRVEGFVYGHVADEGYIESCAGELLRYRKAIGAEDVLVFTDIKKKHSSHAITADVSIAETAHAAEFFNSDGVIVTGASTGAEASLDEVKAVREAVEIPMIIGSGITAEKLSRYFDYADGFIVGSSIKKGGCWKNELDRSRIELLVEEFERLK